MKKTVKKTISAILCLMLVLGCLAAPVGLAAYDPAGAGSVGDQGHSESRLTKAFYNATDVLINSLVGVIDLFTQSPYNWVREKDYVSEGLMEGDAEFIDSPAPDAAWSVGYANASLIEGQDILDGKHFVGGSIKITDKVATEIYDDLKVRTIALDDGSGRGAAVFAVIDGFGLPNSEVRAIRALLADYCAEKGVKSVNVACMHQHSAVDTLGLNGSIVKGIFSNPFLRLFGKRMLNGQNEEYMANLREVVAQSVRDAVDGMTEGKLYYGKVDMSAYMTDKRDPQVLDEFFERFRFVPDNGGAETWFTTSCIHCVGNGAGGTEITGDYPYYMEKYINENYGANFVMILGAEQGTTQDKSSVPDLDTSSTPAELGCYAAVLSQRLAGITDETEVAPILNVRAAEVQLDVRNGILLFAGKNGLFSNTIVRKGLFGYAVVSEIGYMEIGEDIAVPIIPGEAAGEMIYGGYCTAENSWRGTDFEGGCIADLVPDREIVAMGVCNDMVGYIIPDNDYMPLVYPENESLELVALGDNVCSAIMAAFKELIESV